MEQTAQQPGLPKQWDVSSIEIESVHASYWGIDPELMPPLLQLLGKNSIVIATRKKNLISFNELKQIVEYLHNQGFDTSDLNTAIRQAIDRKGLNDSNLDVV